MGQSSLSRGTAKIVNRQNCGGNKKAGLPSTIGRGAQPLSNHIKTNTHPRSKVFFVSSANQIGGIGNVQSMSKSPADGVNMATILRMRLKCN